MAIFKDFRESAKKEIKPKLSVTGIISDAKEVGKRKSGTAGPSVAPDVDRQEFGKRYKRVIMAQYSGLLAMSICIIQMALVGTLSAIVFCGLLLSICGMLYFRFSFTAWRARLIYSEWANRNKDNPVYMHDYLDAIRADWIELFPKKLGE